MGQDAMKTSSDNIFNSDKTHLKNHTDIGKETSSSAKGPAIGSTTGAFQPSWTPSVEREVSSMCLCIMPEFGILKFHKVRERNPRWQTVNENCVGARI